MAKVEKYERSFELTVDVSQATAELERFRRRLESVGLRPSWWVRAAYFAAGSGIGFGVGAIVTLAVK